MAVIYSQVGISGSSTPIGCPGPVPGYHTDIFLFCFGSSSVWDFGPVKGKLKRRPHPDPITYFANRMVKPNSELHLWKMPNVTAELDNTSDEIGARNSIYDPLYNNSNYAAQQLLNSVGEQLPDTDKWVPPYFPIRVPAGSCR